ncbi:thiamine pyrophosphate-binding protein [Streptomyces sp. DK15]|uniref:peroxidase family protein n=1 Tax=Streptomyces sp. DK15 TaxID=2957499 RepID=UPI0029B9ABFC|nr:peroxidase family protein [Streptomyces sp. DK15]MDX2390776.1 thiamine pyrophosphate-binding protein [Streptomyces sp. DK15]
MVVTAGQQVRAMLTMEALLTNPQSTLLPQPAVKWAYEPPRPADMAPALARAVQIAETPPQGPVFVSLPMDDFDVVLDASEDAAAQRTAARTVTHAAVPSDEVRVNRTRPDPVAHTSPDAPPTYENTVTHWWDGSQIYGSDEARCRSLRTGEHGKLILTDGRLPADPRPGMECLDATGMNSDYWAGLSLLHTLFAKEHNAICDLVRSHHPTWDDERLFHTARLVNTALMAKIHTVEWTPGILDTPLLQHSMNANWHGLLLRWVTRRFGRIGGEALGGILGSRTEHHAAPFSMTEEFVSAYRLHPLIPDEITVRDHRRGGVPPARRTACAATPRRCASARSGCAGPVTGSTGRAHRRTRSAPVSRSSPCGAPRPPRG